MNEPYDVRFCFDPEDITHVIWLEKAISDLTEEQFFILSAIFRREAKAKDGIGRSEPNQPRA
jgi:hypothetical protein